MTYVHRPTVNMNWKEKRDTARATSFIENSVSDFIYILNPDEVSIDLALSQGKRVIARIFDPFGDYAKGNSFDNYFHSAHTPEDVYQWFMNSPFTKYKHQEVYFIIGMNEPSANDENDVLSGVKWAKLYGELMTASGYKVALGGWNVAKSIRMSWDGEDKSATAPDVDNGIWDDLLRFAHIRREDVILDIHVYTVGRAWGQLVSGFPHAPEPPPEQLEWGNRLNSGHYPYWHIGRSNALLVRMKEIGAPDVRFGIGECIWDNMDDLKSIVSKMRDDYGISTYMEDMRGILSLRRYYAHLAGVHETEYSDGQFSRDAFEDLSWMDAIYPKNFEYFAVFAWNTNSDWVAYDVSHPTLHHFINLMTNYTGRTFDSGSGGTIPEDSQFSGAWGAFTFSGLNFRETPGVHGAKITLLEGGFRGMKGTDVLQQRAIADGYVWVEIYIQSLDRSGWVAEYKTSDVKNTYFSFIPDTPPPPPPEPVTKYVIDLLGMSMIIPEEEYQRLLTFHRQIVVGLEQAQQIIE